MRIQDATYELFGPLSQGAPGDDASTLYALGQVPGRGAIRHVLDLGVGHGRTTLILSRALPDAQITAIEIHAPFVEKVAERVREAAVAHRVHVVCGEMECLHVEEEAVDLIWAEGSIYVVGVEGALAMWRRWLRPGRCVAFSDLAWWTDTPSEEARDFWESEYPDIASEAATCARAEAAGYRVVHSFRLSKRAHDAYYVPLEARVTELTPRTDTDGELAKIIGGTRKEIGVMRRFPNEAGYTFFVLQSTESWSRKKK